MNLQTMFNRVVKHALSMTEKSQAGPGSCRYRQDSSATCVNRCFIGALIPDEDYVSTWEGLGVWDDSRTGAAIRKAAGITGDMIGAARELQFIHDDNAVEEWPRLLRNFAVSYNLKLPKSLGN